MFELNERKWLKHQKQAHVVMLHIKPYQIKLDKQVRSHLITLAVERFKSKEEKALICTWNINVNNVLHLLHFICSLSFVQIVLYLGEKKQPHHYLRTKYAHINIHTLTGGTLSRLLWGWEVEKKTWKTMFWLPFWGNN